MTCSLFCWSASHIISIHCKMFFPTVGLFLFSGLCLIGSSLFAVGAMLKGSPAMFPVMLIGRLLFGSGNGSLTSKSTALVKMEYLHMLNHIS